MWRWAWWCATDQEGGKVNSFSCLVWHHEEVLTPHHNQLSDILCNGLSLGAASVDCYFGLLSLLLLVVAVCCSVSCCSGFLLWVVALGFHCELLQWVVSVGGCCELLFSTVTVSACCELLPWFLLWFAAIGCCCGFSDQTAFRMKGTAVFFQSDQVHIWFPCVHLSAHQGVYSHYQQQGPDFTVNRYCDLPGWLFINEGITFALGSHFWEGERCRSTATAR
jgi:hypothetical protein